MSSDAHTTITRHRVPVWDFAVRLFHRSLVVMVFTANVFDSPRSLHKSVGYVVIALIAFRVIWGFVGTPHARFADFVPGPRRLLGYVSDVFQGREGDTWATTRRAAP